MQAISLNETKPTLTEDEHDLVKLDHAKLLGFRNLIDVARPEADLSESADLAFQKRGTEVIA